MPRVSLVPRAGITGDAGLSAYGARLCSGGRRHDPEGVGLEAGWCRLSRLGRALALSERTGSMRHRSAAPWLAAALAALLAAGCSGPRQPRDSSSAGPRKVTIGFAAPLTGENAVYGTSMRKAAQLAIDEANASAEVKRAGYRFVLRPADDRGDAKQAVNVANSLVSAGVAGVVGHFNSGCSIPASKVYHRAGIPMVSVSSNPQLTAEGFVEVNRMVAKDTEQGAAAAKLVLERLGLTRVAVVDDSTAYGAGLADEFTREFRAGGGRVVRRERVRPGRRGFAEVVGRLKAGELQAIYYGGSQAEGALIARRAEADGLDVPLVGGDMLQSDEYVKIAGASAAEGDLCTALGLPLERQPGGARFEKAFATAYAGQEPGPYDSYAYDSARVLVKAVLKAGPDREKVARAIRSTEFDGVTGRMTFDANGDTSNKAISAYKVVGGKWRPIEP